MEAGLPCASQFTDCETGVVRPLDLPTGSQLLGLRFYLKALQFRRGNNKQSFPPPIFKLSACYISGPVNDTLCGQKFPDMSIHSLPLIKVCVCILTPTHCINMCFRFHAMLIYDICVVYFRFTHLLGRSRYLQECVSLFVY